MEVIVVINDAPPALVSLDANATAMDIVKYVCERRDKVGKPVLAENVHVSSLFHVCHG